MNRIGHVRKFAGLCVLSLAACNARMIVEDDPAEEPWAGNAADCPVGLMGGTPCTVAEGQVCVQDIESTVNIGYHDRSLCGCFEASSTERRWFCYLGESAPWECPEAEPSNGERCFGHFGTSCTYPERTNCTCSERSGTWKCEEQGRTDLVAPPSSVPAETPISALSAEERAEWCDWYTTVFNGPGYPEPPAAAVDAMGYTVNTGCNLAWDFPCQAMVPTVASSDCEANLALASCDAPIAELSDCLLTVVDSCWPSPHGCARYLERPGCNGTMMVSTLGYEDAGRDVVNACRIRVR